MQHPNWKYSRLPLLPVQRDTLFQIPNVIQILQGLYHPWICGPLKFFPKLAHPCIFVVKIFYPQKTNVLEVKFHALKSHLKIFWSKCLTIFCGVEKKATPGVFLRHLSWFLLGCIQFSNVSEFERLITVNELYVSCLEGREEQLYSKKVIFILFLAQAGESFAIFLHSEAVEGFVVLTLLWVSCSYVSGGSFFATANM